MANIHFFASTDDIEVQSGQSGDEAFGPVGGNSTSQFRVTSLHKGVLNGSVRVDPIAFSVCSGRIRAQQDTTNPDLINLILAPNSDLIDGLPIKYFIYRGIRRDSLIDNSNNLISGELTDLLLNDGDPNNDNPEALGLAFKPAIQNPSNPIFTREDTDSIDTLFFETTTLKALTANSSGLKLGLFHGDHFGFEVILDSCWEDATISILRNVDISSAGAKGNLIDVPSSSSSIQARAIRERVYMYMDFPAFLGLCNPKDIIYQASDSQPTTDISNHQDLYDIILSKFHNKHKIYLDIRNENGLSYNYYDKYGAGEIVLVSDNTDLKWRNKVNPELDTSQPTSYLTHEWPIKIIEGNDSSFNIDNGSNKAGIRLSLNSGVDPIERKAVIRAGFLYYNKNGKSFFGKLYSPKNDSSVKNIVSANSWTKEVTLATPIVNVSSSQKPISSYIRILYERQNESIPNASGRFVATPSSWDNLFIVKSNPIKWQNNRLTSWWLTGQLKFVSPQLGKQHVYDGLAESGIAIDRDPVSMSEARITFYYTPVLALKKPSNYRVVSGTSVSGTGGLPGQSASFFQLKESGSLIDDGALTLHLHKVSEYVGATTPANPNSFLNFLTYTEALPGYLTETNGIDPDSPDSNQNNSRESLYAISMTATEYQNLVSEISNQNFDTSLHPVFLQARIENGRESATNTERAYQKMELSLVGYDSNGEFQEYVVPTSSVQPLSLMSDGHIFCTDEAAKFEPAPIGWDFTEICEIIKNVNNSAQEHSDDLLLYRSSISKIKRYNPVFYGSMERLRQIGAEVILHDNPFNKVRQKYRITIDFDPNFISADGNTDANAYYSGIFPGETYSTSSDSRIRIFNLSTPEAVANLNSPSSINNLYNNNAIGHLNATRYALLNSDLNLDSSQLNELFMNDYTANEISTGAFDGDKLYLESKYNTNGNGISNQFNRISLAQAKSLGLGTLDPNSPIAIKINRTKMISKPVVDQVTYTVGNPPQNIQTVDIPKYNPRQHYVEGLLVHELGHAEYSIKKPLTHLIWSWLDSYFKEKCTNYRNIVTKDVNNGKDELKNYKLVPYIDYPHPTTIIDEDLVPDPTNSLTQSQKNALANQYDNELFAMEFYTKTGGGHLRGSPNSQVACLVEIVFAKDRTDELIDLIKEFANNKRPDGYEGSYPLLSVDYAYCFLNFEEARL